MKRWWPTAWRCGVCGASQAQLRTNWWGDQFCATHVVCSFCGRPGAGAGVCPRCQSVAIVTPAESAAAAAGVTGAMASLGLPPAAGTTLHMANQGLPPGSLGMTNSLTTATDVQSTMYIRTGLPIEVFTQVCAHELTHAWLRARRFPVAPLEDEEGLCGLVSSLVLETRGADPYTRHHLWQMEQNPDPVYGGGYRAAREAHIALGLRAVLDGMGRLGRLPDPTAATIASPNPATSPRRGALPTPGRPRATIAVRPSVLVGSATRR